MKPITALIILDGFGYRTEKQYNAILTDGAVNFMRLWKTYPHTLIGASGMDVGLPDGQMGNSEVGHTNIGAGRIVYQELTRITKSIQDGDFFENPAFVGAIENCKAHDSSLHLMGLCSDGGVHSHLTHLYALVEMARRNGLKKVYVHCFMDGRDVPPSSGKGYLEQLDAKLKEIGCGRIATVMGRFYAMDRDNRFERVERAYAALTYGEGLTAASGPEAMQQSYDRGETDEFVQPTVILTDGKPTATIGANDSVIFFNFRPDRAREISRAYIFDDFNGFARRNGFFPLYYVSMTQYDKTFENNLHVAFKPQSLNNTFGTYVADHGMTQLRIAETEKYAHVTFFFNGGVEEPYKGEDRILVPSPKVATYDLQPEMSAVEVTDKVCEAIRSGKYDFIILNYANCDMVGHTGVFPAVVKAVETVDSCVGRFVAAIKEVGGEVCITADHGNADKMMDYVNNQPFTKHTTNAVPFIVVSDRVKSVKDGALSDIAPTLLTLAGVDIPEEMTGKNLVEL